MHGNGIPPVSDLTDFCISTGVKVIPTLQPGRILRQTIPATHMSLQF